jgi:hypothetical protein
MNGILKKRTPKDWVNQAEHYTKHGSEILNYRREIEEGKAIDCLLYFGLSKVPQGILHYYHYDLPSENIKKGDFELIIYNWESIDRIIKVLFDEATSKFNLVIPCQLYHSEVTYIEGYLLFNVWEKLSQNEEIRVNELSAFFLMEIIKKQLNQLGYKE